MRFALFASAVFFACMTALYGQHASQIPDVTQANDPAMSALLSLYLPGLGQLHNGDGLKALATVTVFYAGFGYAFSGICWGDCTDDDYVRQKQRGLIGGTIALSSMAYAIIDAPIAATEPVYVFRLNDGRVIGGTRTMTGSEMITVRTFAASDTIVDRKDVIETIRVSKNALMKRSPFRAGLYSFLYPGLGQSYNGDTYKGAILMSACWWGILSSLFADESTGKELGVVYGIVVFSWLYSIVDAVFTACKINALTEHLHQVEKHPSTGVRVEFTPTLFTDGAGIGVTIRL